MAELKLVSILSLLKFNFFIPSYQRGYRWETRQIIDLLEDLVEFSSRRNMNEGEFYCLQPLVVMEKIIDDGNLFYEVIDGQQRLTTLHILLTYLEKEIKDANLLKDCDNLYSITYETRDKEGKSSKQFLDNISNTGNIEDDNIDFYYMRKAYTTIENWFKEKKISRIKLVESLLLEDINDKKIDTENNVRFIWYLLDNNENEDLNKIFNRINMGKIKLTSAELIKAIFFINNNGTDEEKEKYQTKIAYEWEKIENELEDNNFWYFLNGKKNDNPTRIGFIFNLIAKEYENLVKIKNNKSTDLYYTYYIFDGILKEKLLNKAELWEKVKRYSNILNEWYNNREYYHLIGFLIILGFPISKILESSKYTKKAEFSIYLTKIINEYFSEELNKANVIAIGELNYKDNYYLIKNLLLLFNIVSTLESKYLVFPFELYLKENWSLEHIHAQKSEALKNNDQREARLKSLRTFFDNSNNASILEEIDEVLLENPINVDDLYNIEKKVFDIFTDDRDFMDSLGNMALLSQLDNSALNNNIFPIKRNIIIEWDKVGNFIPICTKNVFLKYYSSDVIDNSKWDMKDRSTYIIEMNKKLEKYLPKDMENTNG
ncbi:DUF262 domain-containing protein [Clostridium sp.]|uniref:DUF262 domain-containing protein n=1 Tax=Clostridium sp. TaxID=1506 RepID=UPI001A4C4A00|nr:DUF262 domain-containing protein [Clostridium sp.]MBK5236307.1 DUF262 domain-containing protein [Clostridium sp.]